MIEKLRKSIRVLNLSMPVAEAYLFGSYARGNHTASSDIDVLLIVDGEDNDTYKKAYKKIRIPRLELITYSAKDYKKMKERQPETIKKLLEAAVKLK